MSNVLLLDYHSNEADNGKNDRSSGGEYDVVAWTRQSELVLAAQRSH